MLAPTPEEVAYINFEVFPASYAFTESGNTFGNQLKVVCTDKWLVVFVDANIVQLVTRVNSYEKLSYKKYVMQTDDGEVTITREDNCGCGNSLRGFHPYVGIPHVARYPFLKGT